MFSKKKSNSDDEVINLFTRSDMLKHASFHQLRHNNLRKPISPHSIHKDLREKIEDLGCTTELDSGPNVRDYWHMTIDNGEISNVEADYITFDGRVIGSVVKSKKWPWWHGWVKFLAVLTLVLIVGFFILSWLKKWEKRNPRDEQGKLFVFYSGAYQRPEKSSTQIKDWIISLDIMISCEAKESGMYLIKPIFDALLSEADTVIASKSNKTKKGHDKKETLILDEQSQN